MYIYLQKFGTVLENEISAQRSFSKYTQWPLCKRFFMCRFVGISFVKAILFSFDFGLGNIEQLFDRRLGTGRRNKVHFYTYMSGCVFFVLLDVILQVISKRLKKGILLTGFPLRRPL